MQMFEFDMDFDVDNELDRCYGCFGASFNDCENCSVYKNILDVNEIKMCSDLHREEENNGKEEIL